MNRTGCSSIERVRMVFISIVIIAFSTGLCYGMSPLGHAVKGKECMERGQCEEAIGHFTQAIGTGGFDERNLAALYSNRGIAYALTKQYDKALEDFNQAMKLDPSNTSAVYNMSCLYALIGKTEESCVWLTKAAEKGYNDWAHIKADATLDNIRNASCYKEIMAGR